MRVAVCVLISLSVGSAHARQSDEDRWAETVSVAAESVVSLKLSQLRDFDDSPQGGSNATGFVVDAERGIVLTNRHVVSSGPIRLSATFQNQERVDAVPLYRDPIHDFAFVRYDPALLKYAEPASLALRPDKVRTGMNIRVIGSDGGEQLSILPGTIARLDRQAPSYGRYGYNDFNTFYLQAASGTSGGSSGSPVLDVDGDVVALNAAANSRTASSFFLPLPRIKHALERLQREQSVSRGGLQTIFTHEPYRELQRLGLDKPTEARVRQAEGSNTGMLVVNQVIPGGVADGVLEEGDILVAVDSRIVTDFIRLESWLDARLAGTTSRVSLDVIRQGRHRRLQSSIADLHALAPARLVELGDAVVQDMSIQHARAMNRAQEGAVVMRPGYVFTRAGIPEGAVIVNLAGSPITGIDDLLEAIRQAPRDRRLSTRYIVPGREFVSEVAQFSIDSQWFEHRLCERVDDARFWDCESIALPGTDPYNRELSLRVPAYRDAVLDRVAPGMVQIDFHIPYAADNVYARHFTGVGLVVDRREGLVAVDRNTVPIGLGEAELTLFGSHVVPGEVVFLHPRHNIALLRFDPAPLIGSGFEALELVDELREPMPDLQFVGYRRDGTLRQHPIDRLSPLTVQFDAPGLPRFQQSALDLLGVEELPPSLGGPVVDADGRVHGLYMSFAYEVDRKIEQAEWVMPAAVIAEALRLYRGAEAYRSLDLRLGYRGLAEARQRGLPDDWLERYLARDADSRRVVYVEQVLPGTDAARQLVSGDMLLAIDDTLVADLFHAEQLAQAEELELTVLRDGAIKRVDLRPSSLDMLGTGRLVSWAGALFQAPHQSIGYQKGVVFPGVYVASTEDGSPALWDGLYRNRFVAAVDGEPVKDLDDFLRLVSQKPQDSITRLSVISMSGRKRIVTVQPEYNFWPTFEIVRGERGWRRINYLN